MSDIKTVKEFEQALFYQSPIPIGWAVQQYSYLITTIESLEARIEMKDQALEGARDMFNEYVKKRNIEVLIWKDAATFANNHKLSTASLQKELSEKDTLIESQKEEVDKAVAEAKYQVELTLGFNQMHTDISLQLSDKNAEIDSLKAITEEQNEKLKNLDYLVDELNKSNKAVNNMLDRAQIKNKSLEAITELAKQAFKDIDFQYMLWIDNEIDCSLAAENMDTIAENTLTEIEKLQNE